MAVQVGLRDLYLATVASDTVLGTVYDTPEIISEAINAKVSPKYNTEKLYADDGVSEIVTELEEFGVEFEVKDLPLPIQAKLFGHTLSNGILIKNKDDIAPDVAIGFRSIMSNGKYRYVWLLKGKFESPESEYKTKEGKPSFQTPKAKGTFVARKSDGNVQFIGDENEAGFTQAATWFNTVPVIGLDTTPPTVTVSPTDAETGVLVSADIIWTFSESIFESDMNDGNFYVMKADGTPVAGELSISADKKVVTFNPTSNLTAATQYVAVASKNVRDLAGNKMAATSVTNFTTA